ncbi:MAG: AAA family ATPase [Rhodothermales bacterium]|nr:AAA family ATPase [Rhodothermales bacterium]
MTNQFEFQVPTTDGQTLSFGLNAGDTLYLLGANGTGKSSLVSRFANQHQNHARRISAHRQTWFESNTLDMTPRTRQDLEDTTRSQDAQPQARWQLWNAGGRANMAIFDLIDADTMQERKIAAFVRAGDSEAAFKEAETPSPMQVINELMRLSNLPIEVSLEAGQKVVARKKGGTPYSVAELSDGERNAFLIAIEVLTAKPGTLILIDEPERHLHRSIISPLLKLLFDRRKDCAFIVSTHELMLPLDTPSASTLLVRGCEYQGPQVRAWTVDLITPGVTIEDELKRDLFGGRRKMIFVEGAAQSLDVPLYSLLFPDVSVTPKQGCRDVEHAVRGLRAAAEVHWVAAWGIVDNDQRTPEDLQRLKDAGIWALTHYSVEALYYHPTIIDRIAKRQAALTGHNADDLVRVAVADAVAAAKAKREHLVTSAVLKVARKRVMAALPKHSDVKAGQPSVKIEVDIAAVREAEEARFDELVTTADWDGLITRYPLRESSAFDRVVNGLKITDQATYRAAVLKLVQDDVEAMKDLRDLLGDLYTSVTA